MIINGQAVKGAGRLAHHLQKQENELVSILEISGTVANDNLREALRDMEAVGKLTKSRTGRVLYHANIDPRKDEVLTPEQYIKAADKLMEKLGMERQPRVIVMHIKKGRQHAHLVVQLTDIEKGKLKPLSNNYYKHKAVSRELEKEFQLEKTPERKTGKTYSQSEAQQVRKLAIDAPDFRKILAKEFSASRNGQEFKDRLAEYGLKLAQGKRIVIVDHQGSTHSLPRQLKAVANSREVKKKLSDITDRLPDIEAVKLEVKSDRTLDTSQEKSRRLITKFRKAKSLDELREQFTKSMDQFRPRLR
jgi:hypothetical protein